MSLLPLSIALFLSSLAFVICSVVILVRSVEARDEDRGTRRFFKEVEDASVSEGTFGRKSIRQVTYADMKPEFFLRFFVLNASLSRESGATVRALPTAALDRNPGGSYSGQLALCPSKDVRSSDASFNLAGIYENSVAAIVAALEGHVPLCLGLCTSLVSLLLQEGAVLRKNPWENALQDQGGEEAGGHLGLFDKAGSPSFHGLRTRYSCLSGKPSAVPEYAVETISSRVPETFAECGRKAGGGLLAWKRTEMGYQAGHNAWVALALAFVVNLLGEQILSRPLADLYLGASDFILHFVRTETGTDRVAPTRDDGEMKTARARYLYDPDAKRVGERAPAQEQGLGAAASPHQFKPGYCAHLDDFDHDRFGLKDPRAFSFDECLENLSLNQSLDFGDQEDIIKTYYEERFNGEATSGKRGFVAQNLNEYSTTTKTEDHAVLLAAAHQLRVADRLRGRTEVREELGLMEDTCLELMSDMLNYSTPLVSKKVVSKINYYSSAIVELAKRKSLPVGTKFVTENLSGDSMYELVVDPPEYFKEEASTFVDESSKSQAKVGKGLRFIASQDFTLKNADEKFVVKIDSVLYHWKSSHLEAGSMIGSSVYTNVPYMQYYRSVAGEEDRVDRIQVSYNSDIDSRMFGSNAKSQFYPMLCGHLDREEALLDSSRVPRDFFPNRNPQVADGRTIDDVAKWAVDNLAVSDSFDSPAGCGKKTHEDRHYAKDPCELTGTADSLAGLRGIFFGFRHAPAGGIFTNVDFECTAVGIMALQRHLARSLAPRKEAAAEAVEQAGLAEAERLDRRVDLDDLQATADTLTEKINSRLAGLLRIAARTKQLYTSSQTKGIPGSTHIKEFYEGKENPNLSGEGFSKFRNSDAAATAWGYLALLYTVLLSGDPRRGAGEAPLAELANPLSTEIEDLLAARTGGGAERYAALRTGGLRSLLTAGSTAGSFSWKLRAAGSAPVVGRREGNASLETLPPPDNPWYGDANGIYEVWQGYAKETSASLKAMSFFAKPQDAGPTEGLRCTKCSCNDISFEEQISEEGELRAQDTFQDVSASTAVNFYCKFLDGVDVQRKPYKDMPGVGVLDPSPQSLCKLPAFVNEPSYRIQSQILRRYMQNFTKNQATPNKTDTTTSKTDSEGNTSYVNEQEAVCITTPRSIKSSLAKYREDQALSAASEEDYGWHQDFLDFGRLFQDIS